MRSTSLLAGLFVATATVAFAADAPPIVIIDSAMPTKEIGSKPGGIYVGETIIHKNADETVQVGVWEADVSKTKLIDSLKNGSKPLSSRQKEKIKSAPEALF